jgi:low affinity Fe/Cu permease
MKRYIRSLIGSENRTNGLYARLAETTAVVCGRSGTFVLSCSVIILWLISGPIFWFSDTWQLIINTGTTIVTFLMMFLLQNTHNRDTEVMQKKLDALLIEISNLSQKE